MGCENIAILINLIKCRTAVERVNENFEVSIIEGVEIVK